MLDTSIVLTGLPTIHRDLGFSDTGLAWVRSAYTLTFGGFLLLAARAGDILGRRRMLVAGLALFTLASVAIGAAPSPGALALLAGVLCNERLAAQHIMPLRLFGNRQRSAAYGARMSLRPCGAAHR